MEQKMTPKNQTTKKTPCCGGVRCKAKTSKQKRRRTRGSAAEVVLLSAFRTGSSHFAKHIRMYNAWLEKEQSLRTYEI
jgi:hypothetical protein